MKLFWPGNIFLVGVQVKTKLILQLPFQIIRLFNTLLEAAAV